MVMHINIPEEKSYPLLPPDVEVARLKKRDFKMTIHPEEQTAERRLRSRKKIFFILVVILLMFIFMVTGINMMLARELAKQKREIAQLTAMQNMLELQQVQSFFNFPKPDFSAFFNDPLISSSSSDTDSQQGEIFIFSLDSSPNKLP